MQKLMVLIATLIVVLGSGSLEAQWSANDALNGGVDVTNLQTGEIENFAPPEGIRTVRTLGYDPATGLLWLEGVRGDEGAFLTMDPLTGEYQLASLEQSQFNGFESVFIPSASGLSSELVAEHAQAAASLAGILDIAPPGEGQENFVNFSADSINGSEAYGVSYARNVGRWRFGAAYGRNDRGDDAGKVQAGFGW